MLLQVWMAVLLCRQSSSEKYWIDLDTPEEKHTTTSYVDGSTYHLVCSVKLVS